MRYLTWLGEVKEFLPAYHGYRNVGVTAVNNTCIIKDIKIVNKAVGGFLVSSASPNISEYLPSCKYYGTLIPDIHPSEDNTFIFAHLVPGGEIDPDLLSVFKNVCMHNKGKEVFLKTYGENRGKFFTLKKLPLKKPPEDIVVNVNRQNKFL